MPKSHTLLYHDLTQLQTYTRCALFHRIDEKVTLFSRLIGFLVNEALPTHFTYALIRLKQHATYVPTKQSENGMHSKWESEKEHMRSEAPSVDHTFITNGVFDVARTGSASEHANDGSKGGLHVDRGSVASSTSAQKDSGGPDLHASMDAAVRGHSTSPRRNITPRVRMPKFVWAKHVLEKGLASDTHGQVCVYMCVCACVCGSAEEHVFA
jgi:hypothetical protein